MIEGLELGGSARQDYKGDYTTNEMLKEKRAKYAHIKGGKEAAALQVANNKKYPFGSTVEALGNMWEDAYNKALNQGAN